MKNSFNTYIQVPKGLAQEIHKMKEEQSRIPHYKAKVIELGDLTKQSKCQIMRKMKHNLMEIDKQEKNEHSKGWISSCGYTAFSYKETYVFPAFDYIFDLGGLAETVNGLIEEKMFEFWDKHLEGKLETFHTKKTYPVGTYISFITKTRQDILWAIRDCKDITDLQLLVSFNKRDLYEWEDFEGSSIIPASVNFYIQTSDEDIDVRRCESSSARGEHFDHEIGVSSYWIKEGLNNNREKLSNWRKLFNEQFGVIPKE